VRALARHAEAEVLGKRMTMQHRKLKSLVPPKCGCCGRAVVNEKKDGSYLYERLPCSCQKRPYDFNCGRCSSCCRCAAPLWMRRGELDPRRG
jgi:hypothetical protein